MTSIWTSPSAWRRTRDRDARRGLTRTGSFGPPRAALWCWASPDHIASSSELGCRRVGEHLKRSIRLGFIESVEGGGGNSSGRVYVIDNCVQRAKCGRAERVIDQLQCRGSGCGDCPELLQENKQRHQHNTNPLIPNPEIERLLNGDRDADFLWPAEVGPHKWQAGKLSRSLSHHPGLESTPTDSSLPRQERSNPGRQPGQSWYRRSIELQRRSHQEQNIHPVRCALVTMASTPRSESQLQLVDL